MNFSHYLTHLGPANLPNFSYIADPNYSRSPAAFYFLAFYSLFYNKSIIMATMPILYSATAFIAALIVYYCQRFFSLSLKVSLCIAGIIICGRFYRYIIGNYFLTSIISTFTLLAVLIEIGIFKLEISPTNFLKLLFVLLPYEGLLLFTYPALFFTHSIFQCGIVYLILLYTYRFHSLTIVLKRAIFFTFALIATISVLALLDLKYFQNAAITALSFSHIIAGWPLKLLSPFAMLGLPCHMELISFIYIEITLFIFIAIAIIYLLHIKSTKNLNITPVGFAFLWVSLSAYIVYVIYFYFGNTNGYQPWKFASLYMLPFAGALWAGVAANLKNKKHEILFFIFTLLIILSNAIFYRFPLDKLNAKYERLQMLNNIANTNLWIKMANPAATFLSVYYIQDTQLHLLSGTYGYYPIEHLTQIRPHQPIFIETSDDCGAPEKSIKIKGLGCLYFEPPLLQINQNYLFKDSPFFLETSGFSGIESQGQWTSAFAASVTLYINEKDLLKNPQGYINFEVQPFLYAQLNTQHININWGENKNISYNIMSRQWFSISYERNDWEVVPSSEFEKITIHFNLPNATAPHQVNALSLDPRLLGLNFIQFSMSDNK